MKAAAVIYVKSVEPMRRFYSQCFDMLDISSAEGYRILESDSLRLSLVRAPDDIAASIRIEAPPRRRTDTPIKLVFEVGSLEEMRELTTSLGGSMNPPTSEWSHLGAIHCDGADPEGNIIQFASPERRAHQRER